ncbi:MAG: FkbM family methyltransferase [Bacteroidales bacterium]
MKRKGNLVRQILYKYLPLESYLRILSRLYLTSFNWGLLKGNRLYEYPYFLKNVIGTGDICIDVGANLGYYSTVLSKLAGPQGRVYAIEPVEPVRKVLETNTRRYKNIEILPYALGEEDTTIQISNTTFREKGFLASGSFFVSDRKSGRRPDETIAFTASMKKGSKLFLHLERLDFIKCDIEGYEIVVLPELEPLILKFRPVLLVETAGTNREKLLERFRNNGFEGYILTEGTLTKATKEGTKDIFFVPEEKNEMIEPFLKIGN